MAVPSLQEHFTPRPSGSPLPVTRKVTTTEVTPCFRRSHRRMELVNVTVAKEDYEKLKALGWVNSDYIEMALTRYVHALRDMTFHRDPECSGWGRGPVASFLCAVPKDIVDEIRNLPGRFDEHAFEATRLLSRGDVPSSGPVTTSSKSRLKSALSRGLLFATYAGLVFFASRVFRLIDNLSIVSR